MTSVRGPAASIWWGYHQAALLGPWTMTAVGDGSFALEASVLQANAFRLAQAAVTLRVPRQNGSVWKWPILSLSIAGETLTATLGPQE